MPILLEVEGVEDRDGRIRVTARKVVDEHPVQSSGSTLDGYAIVAAESEFGPERFVLALENPQDQRHFLPGKRSTLA